MSSTIRCTCGTNIGSFKIAFYQLWNHVKEINYDKIKNYISIENLDVDPDFSVEAGAILDALHLTNECCRMNLLSNVD